MIATKRAHAATTPSRRDMRGVEATDPPGPQPIDKNLEVGPRTRSGFVRNLSDRAASNFELAILLGVLAGLCWWFVAEQRKFKEASLSLEARLMAAPVPVDRFAFADRNGFAAAMQIVPAPQFATLSHGPRGLMGLHHVAAGSDPLTTVTVSGLPARTEMSSGRFLSPTTWAMALGDLNDIVIRLPQSGGEPVRANVDVRARSGALLHSFSVEVQQAGTAIESNERSKRGLSGPDPRKSKANAKSKRKNRQSKSVSDHHTAPSVAGSSPSQPVAPAANKAPESLAPKGPVPGQAAIASGTSILPNQVPPSLLGVPPVLGLFPPDPRDSEHSDLTAQERDDPRHLILRGLGPGIAGP